MNNWLNKDSNIYTARQHTIMMDEKYNKEIIKSIDSMSLYDPKDVHKYDTTKLYTGVGYNIFTMRTDSVSSLFGAPASEKVAVLDFASYKTPGGMFMQGSMAQEESLCHASDLYNILASDKADRLFYNRHGYAANNNSLYRSDMLYVPDVLFVIGKDKNYSVIGDVIVAAAPNANAARKYHHIGSEAINTALRDRVIHVLTLAKMHGVTTIVLGAFGCGVFGNDIKELAKIYYDLLYRDDVDNFKNLFKRVIIPIPDNLNYTTYMYTIETLLNPYKTI